MRYTDLVRQRARRLFVIALVTVVAVSTPRAQSGVFGKKPSEPVVAGAPYSAEAVTTLKLTMFDGTKFDQTLTAKMFRDSAGRMRHEQTISGLGGLDPSGQALLNIIVIVDPVGNAVYTLYPTEKTAMKVSLPPGSLVPAVAPAPAAAPPGTPGVKEEALGTKQIDGLNATGKRTTVSIPAGQLGNDRAILVTDERWESTDLKIVIQSHYYNPMSGDVDYKVTNIKRAEPDKALFTVPLDYKIMDVPVMQRTSRM